MLTKYDLEQQAMERSRESWTVRDSWMTPPIKDTQFDMCQQCRAGFLYWYEPWGKWLCESNWEMEGGCLPVDRKAES